MLGSEKKRVFLLNSLLTHTVPSRSQHFKNVPRMTGAIVSKSASALGEVALEKLNWRRKVTVAGGEERWRLGQQNREDKRS